MLLKVKRVSTFKEVQKIPESVVRFLFSLGCSPLWLIAEQRGEMNPIPATTQDGLVFLLVRFLLESYLPPVNEWINLNIGFKFEVRYVLSFGSMTIPSGNSNF